MNTVRKSRNSTLKGQQPLDLKEMTMPCQEILVNQGLGRKDSWDKTMDEPVEKTLEGS